MLHSYSTIFTIGHKAVQPLLSVPCIVEEKIDGSQFSFCKQEGAVFAMRSKGVEVWPGQNKMFNEATRIEAVLPDTFPVGYTVRCEYLQKPKHNILQYACVPANHLIVFDVETPDGTFLSYADKVQFCALYRLDIVPKLYEGVVTLEVLQELLDRDSYLGGTKIEGVVIKPVGYNLWGTDKKVLMAKYVSEKFKEKHHAEWKATNHPDIIGGLVANLCTEARWNKAIQHLRESGKLENSPRDIGAIIREVVDDTKREEVEFIKDRLFAWAWKEIGRRITHGLPEWYKQKLMEEAFPAAATMEETQ